jgi:hypothetical protein
MGEKYDGIRACWNPDAEALYLFLPFTKKRKKKQKKKGE